MSLFVNIDHTTERANYWNAFAGNIFLSLFSGGTLITARFFPFSKLPLGFCVFLNLTGIPCPTCGFSRAFCAFTHDNWALGFQNCPLAAILYLLTIAVLIYNAVVVIAGILGFQIRRGSILQLSSKKAAFLAVVFFLLLLANWIYRLIMGLA